MTLRLQSVLVLLVLCLAVPGAGPARADTPRGTALVPSAPAGEIERLALVVGNSSYAEGRLDNPANDARDMEKSLRAVGFDVILVTDTDIEAFDDAVREFGRRLADEKGVGLFYYAGHGMQVGGENYLIPIGAKIQAERDVKYRSFPLGMVLGEMQAAGNPMNIVVLDACRNNPFRSSFRSSYGGLAKTDAPTGTIIAYATAPGRVAADGDGRNGIYTKHLLEAIVEDGLTIEQVLKRVRIGVMSETDGRQTPWESSSLTGDFYFREPEPEEPEPVAPPIESAEYHTLSGPQIASLPPSQTSYSTDDLESAATREQAVRAAWEQRMGLLEESYGRAQRIDASKASAGVKHEAWARLLDAFAEDDPDRERDDEIRDQAALRQSHWKDQMASETPLTRPQAEAAFAIEDLEAQAELERKTRSEWSTRQQQMDEAYRAAIDYQQQPQAAELNRAAWERFLSSFSDDNPFSREDEAMRVEAGRMLEHWSQVEEVLPEPEVATAELPAAPPSDSAGQARRALEAYRSAYEARDFGRLAEVWLMNPDQERSMEMLFECADEIEVGVEELGIHVRGSSVSIDFQQHLRFDGKRCVMKSADAVTQMTATLFRRSATEWVISSILPAGPKP